ncbi:MAG TPA: hypothetical protein VGQ83_31470 [Polyangia bacterium]|jgi:hypothetical protein
MRSARLAGTLVVLLAVLVGACRDPAPPAPAPAAAPVARAVPIPVEKAAAAVAAMERGWQCQNDRQCVDRGLGHVCCPDLKCDAERLRGATRANLDPSGCVTVPGQE